MQGRAPRRIVRSPWLWLALIAIVAGLAFAYRSLLQAAITPNPIPSTSQSIERGRTLWKLDCEACHGPQGRGDGPAAAALRKKPKDLTRIARPPIFPNGIVAYRIANGGEVMPAWKSALTEQDIWDLVNFIRAQRSEAAN
jgi:mono/diheme cytochrome c family protein